LGFFWRRELKKKRANSVYRSDVEVRS